MLETRSKWFYPSSLNSYILLTWHPQRVIFSVGAPKGQSEKFIKCLEDAVAVVRSLILAP